VPVVAADLPCEKDARHHTILVHDTPSSVAARRCSRLRTETIAVVEIIYSRTRSALSGDFGVSEKLNKTSGLLEKS